MIVIEAIKIAYMPLPKAGCTSVKEVLARLDPDVTIPKHTSETTWHDIYPTMRFRPHRWETVETPDWFRFCVIRDPFERLISCYFNRVVKLQELKNSRKIRDRRDGIDLPTDPDIDFFLQNLELYRKMSSVVKHHTIPAWLFLGPDLSRYTAVYPLENLGELAADLTSRLGRKVKMPHGNATHSRFNVDDLHPQTRDALKSHMAQEYALVAGYYDNPLA